MNAIAETWCRDLTYEECIKYAELKNERIPTQEEFNAGVLYLNYDHEVSRMNK